MSAFILHAFEIIDEQCKTIGHDKILDGLKSQDLAWVHLDADHEGTKPWLETELSFLDPFIVSALTAEETRPRVTKIGDGVMLILRGMNFNEGQADEDMVSVRLYADSERIISLTKRPVRSILEIADGMNANTAPKSAGQFLQHLIYGLSKRVDNAVARVDDQMDDTERLFVDKPDIGEHDYRRDLSVIRMKAIKIRRHLAPQREALFELKSADVKWLNDVDKRSIFESYNRTVRAVEELDAVRERAQIIKDEISSGLSEKLNRNTYVLSLIAAIFLPLGFLTGLFGINIGGLPGIESGSAFWVFCISMIVLVGIQIIVFKKLKWF